jgi:phage terminase large subunit-like protein
MPVKRNKTRSRKTGGARQSKTRRKKTERDYLSIAIAFAEQAIADKKGHRNCKWIRLAGKRFLDDLKRAGKKSCQFYFDEWHARDVCDFIEKLPHVEGVWDEPNIVLHPAHVFFLVNLFGFRLRKSIYMNGAEFYPRRFTSALFCVARKNAKSSLAAGVMIYCQCCEPEPGAQILSAATTYPQAEIIFKIAKKMVSKTHALIEAFGLQVWAKAISRIETMSSFKAIHAKASTQDGLNPSHISLDEIHAHKNSDLVNVLTSAAGGRSNPLWLYTTTEGYTNAGPWQDLRKFCQQILEGIFGYTTDHFLVVYFALDKEDEDFDETKLIKANPLIDVNPHLLTAIKKEAVEAKQMPSKLSEFKIKRLNRPASVADGAVDIRKWDLNSGAVDLKYLKKFPCYGGLDLASTTDLTVFRLVWVVGDLLYTYGWRFVPQSSVAMRTERGTVPYASWVNSGQLIQTDGDITDYSVIEKKILEVKAEFDLKMVAFDKWNAVDLVNRLSQKDVPLIEFVQGTRSYHPAWQALERAYIGAKLRHGGDEILKWCASNLVMFTDENMNKKPSRKKSSDKIDDMCALLMAIGISQASKEKEYQMFVLG